MRVRVAPVLGLIGSLFAAAGCSSSASRESAPRDEPQPVVVDREAERMASLERGPWSHHAGKLPFVVGYEQGTIAMKESGKPPMYFFTTTWCGWCRKLAQESFNDPEIVKLVKENFTPIIVDGDKEKQVTKKYNIFGYPKVVFASMTGTEAVSVNGYVPKDRFLALAKEAKAKLASMPAEHAAMLER